MANVIGLTVWVKLRHPPGSIVYGTVVDLVPNSHLTLRDVSFAGQSTRWEQWSVQATAIENLEVIDSSQVPPPPPPPPAHIPTPTSAHHSGGGGGVYQNIQQHHNPPPGFRQVSTPSQTFPFPPQPAPAPPAAVTRVASEASLPPIRHVSAPSELPAAAPQRQPFVDPAIVSYGTSSPSRPAASRPSDIETPIKSMLAKAAANLPSPSSPFIAEAGKANVTQKLAAAARQSSTSQSPSIRPSAAEPTLPEMNESTQPEAAAKKKVRRGQKSKKQTPPTLDTADPPPVMNAEVSRNGNDMNGSVKRGKGWRNTPLLQPSPQAASPLSNTKKSRRKQKEELDTLGDTTDIQDIGDFDFEGELKKFDKKTIFDEIRQGDTTADEDRLVSHNKARPGTYGGKNLHPTEPVLSPKVTPQYNSAELDSTSDADTELNLSLANGRSSSKHSVSRTVFPKTKPSRQNSAQVEKPHPLSASMSSDRNRNRSTTSLVTRAKIASLATTSPHPDRASSPHSMVSTAKLPETEPVRLPESHLVIQPHMSPCPTLLPRALGSLEEAVASTFGLSHDAVTENAGRSIADAALHLSDLHRGIRRPSRTNTLRGSVAASATLNSPNEQPTVVVLAGNHDVGARALAAARQLLGRNVRIIAAESLYESAETHDPLAKTQTAILRRMGRGGANIKRGLWRRVSQHIKNLSGPPAVIIDALLAGATYDTLLTSNATHSAAAQLETREMIDWANRSRAPVLSVGCPSGLSGVNGISTIVEGEPLAVRPEKVLALGAPMQGLLKAMDNGEKLEIAVADIGINIALKSDEAVSFGHSWVVDLKYVESAETT